MRKESRILLSVNKWMNEWTKEWKVRSPGCVMFCSEHWSRLGLGSAESWSHQGRRALHRDEYQASGREYSLPPFILCLGEHGIHGRSKIEIEEIHYWFCTKFGPFSVWAVIVIHGHLKIEIEKIQSFLSSIVQNLVQKLAFGRLKSTQNVQL